MPGKQSEESAASRVRRVVPAAADGWVPVPEAAADATPQEPPPPRADREEEPVAGAARGVTGAVPDLHAAVRAAVAAKLPATLRGGRYGPGRRGWRALVAVAVIAALISGGLWWRSRSVPTEVPPVVATTSRPAAASDRSPPARRIVVDVAGKVRRPGIVRLPAGSRVVDAIHAAGGLRPGAKTVGLNLARKLTDGEQVVVDLPAASAVATVAPATGGPAATAGPKLDLNAATLEQLDTLPGVGPVLAQRIVDYRTEHGGFQSVSQLEDVSGIGDARYADISPRVQV